MTDPANDNSVRRPITTDELFRVLSWLLPNDDKKGARDIARALDFGDSAAAIRKAFHLLEHSTTYPARKDGGQWALSLTTWQAKKWSDERRALVDEQQELLVLLYKLLVSSVSLYLEAALGNSDVHNHAKLAIISNEIARLIDRVVGEREETCQTAA
jgi:hypothetical protein